MTVPPEAITAAAAAIYDLSAIPTSGRGDLGQWSNRMALAALEAAAPLIGKQYAAAQREADAQLAERYSAQGIDHWGNPIPRPFADLLRGDQP